MPRRHLLGDMQLRQLMRPETAGGLLSALAALVAVWLLIEIIGGLLGILRWGLGLVRPLILLVALVVIVRWVLARR
jgi:hypothetical protein